MEKFNMKDSETITFESKPIKCNVCEKVFAATSTLQLHREILHDENSFNDVSQVEAHKIVLNTTDLHDNDIKFEDYSLDKNQILNDFSDVTLACEDKQIKTHKSIFQGLTIQFEKYQQVIHQDYSHIQVRVEYQNGLFEKQTDNFQLEEVSVLYIQVRVENQIQRKNPPIKNQNKIFQIF